MTLTLKVPVENKLKPRILVIGVGGAGGNAVESMMKSNLEEVDFVVAKTSPSRGLSSVCKRRIQLGASLTRGQGTGSRPEIGQAAAEDSLDEIVDELAGYHMVFITAGMGRGTGSGAAPIIARAAKERGILTVGVLTKPFEFEGARRMRVAEVGIEEFQKNADSSVVISNQNLFKLAGEKVSIKDAFSLADEVLTRGVRSIIDLIRKPGLVNLDFKDIHIVLHEMGRCVMGMGQAKGAKRAVTAAKSAISNPLLEDISLKGAKSVLINITGGPDLCLFEVDEAASLIRSEVHPDANIIVGSTIDEVMEKDQVEVSVIASGMEETKAKTSDSRKRLSVSLEESKGTHNQEYVEVPTERVVTPEMHQQVMRLSTEVDEREVSRRLSFSRIKKTAYKEFTRHLPRQAPSLPKPEPHMGSETGQ